MDVILLRFLLESLTWIYKDAKLHFLKMFPECLEQFCK